MADEAKTPSVDVEGLRALHAAATPGPWTFSTQYDATDDDEPARLTSATHDVACSCCLVRSDAAPIVAAHNALPALLDIAEAVKAWGAAMERRLRASNVGSNVEWIAMTEAESDARGAVAAIARALAGGDVTR